MDEIRRLITELYRAGKAAQKFDNTLCNAGWEMSPALDIYGHITNAVYDLIGEKTGTFEESFTSLVFNTTNLSEERAVSMLINKYEALHPAQPKPQIMHPNEMGKLYRQNGGYMTPEGEFR